MFTGLVETIGQVALVSGETSRRITVQSSLLADEIKVGDSIAIDGCCQTVVSRRGNELEFEAATETLRRTTLGDLRVGDNVHLERALRLSDRLDGHLVTGHVDCVGVVKHKERDGSALYMGVEVTPEVSRLIAPQGSVALAGISLTVTRVEAQTFFVGLIAHTLGATTLEQRRVGDRLNVEADIIARYVARLMGGQQSSLGSTLTTQFLKDKGFL